MDPKNAAEQEFGQHEDGLTEEERAALEGPEDQGALPTKDWEREFPQAGDAPNPDIEPGIEHADEDHGGKPDGEDGNPDPGEPAGDDAGATPGADNGEAGNSGASAPQNDTPPHRPLLVAEVPEGAEDRLKAIADEKSKLLEQLDEGDITVREYQAQYEKLNEEQTRLNLALHTAKMAEQMERQRLQAEWEGAVHSFLRANPEFQKAENPILFNALDQCVREIAASEEGQSLTNAQILERAKDRVEQAIGRKPKAPAEEGKPEGNGKTPPSQPKHPAAPPTLARVPAADLTTGDGEFAQLDRLLQEDPLAYEEALARLDDKTRDRYMQSR